MAAESEEPATEEQIKAAEQWHRTMERMMQAPDEIAEKLFDRL